MTDTPNPPVPALAAGRFARLRCFLTGHRYGLADFDAVIPTRTCKRCGATDR